MFFLFRPKPKPKYIDEVDEDEELGYPSYSRPDPIGEVRDSRQPPEEEYMQARQLNSDYVHAQPLRPIQLPPLESPQAEGGRKKKKKKFLKSKVAKPKQETLYYDDDDDILW